MSLLDLPDECLVHVMRQLGEARSQLAAARACTRLRLAAAAALDAVALPSLPWEADAERHALQRQAQQVSLQRYLGQHGQHVTSLHIQYAAPLRALPVCARLRSLELRSTAVQLGPGGGHQGVLQAATGLTRLAMYNIPAIQDGASAAAAALATLTNLRELDWSCSYLRSNAVLPGAFLSSLVQLTCLALDNSLAIDDATLQHLGRLTNLQELGVSAHNVSAACAGLQQLQELQQLTSLSLGDLGLCVGSGSTAGISTLTALRRLSLRNCDGFAPACLAGVAQLQTLELWEGTVVAGGADGVAVFLAQLAGLQQLQELRLHAALTSRAPAAAAYAALSASSHLSALELDGCVLPDGVWQHVFEHTRPLPNLLSFRVDPHGGGQQAAALSAAALDTLVGCCAQLRDLAFRLDEPSPEALAPLLRLSALTSLGVAGVTDAALRGVPLWSLTSLRSLSFHTDDPQACSRATLLQLTALRQLTYLRFPTMPAAGLHDDEEDEHDSWLELWNPNNRAPDVWLQLLQRCLRCDEPCQVPLSLLAQQALVSEGQLAELAAVKAEAAELRSRVSRLEQLVTALLPGAGGQPQQQQ